MSSGFPDGLDVSEYNLLKVLYNNLGHGTMVVNLRQVGTTVYCKDWLKMLVNTPISRLTHDFSVRLNIMSAALEILILLRVDFT